MKRKTTPAPSSVYRVECLGGPDKGQVREALALNTLDALDQCAFRPEPGGPIGAGPLCVTSVVRAANGDVLRAITAQPDGLREPHHWIPDHDD